MKYIQWMCIALAICSCRCLFGQNPDTLWMMYNRGHLDSALSAALPLIKQRPTDQLLNLLVGRIYADQGNPRDALHYLQIVINEDAEGTWRKAWAISYRGSCYYALGKYDSAAHDLSDCLAMNATKAVNSRTYNCMMLFGLYTAYKNWKSVETEHFLFHFPPDSYVPDISLYMKREEAAFDSINSFFHSTLPKKIDFFVWNNNEQARHVGMRSLAFAEPLYCIVHTALGHTRGHEMAHIIAYHAVQNPIVNGFINEGIGVCFNLNDEDKMAVAKQSLNEMNDRDAIPIALLWKEWNLFNGERFYPVAGAFVRFLIDSGGKEKFMKLLQNQSYENAESLYGKQLQTIIGDFEKQLYGHSVE